MSTVVAPARARPAVLRATPWAAGAWALTFACLSGLALLDRAPHPWSPSGASALGGLTAVQVTWLIATTASLVLVAGVVGVTGRTTRSLRVTGWLLVGHPTLGKRALRDEIATQLSHDGLVTSVYAGRRAARPKSITLTMPSCVNQLRGCQSPWVGTSAVDGVGQAAMVARNCSAISGVIRWGSSSQ